MDSDQYSFVEACMSGSLDRVQRVWNSYGHIININVASVAFVRAACNGHLDVMKWLLETTKVDPSFDDNNALFYAVENGHIEIVKMLLQMDSVNPCSRKKDLLEFFYPQQNRAAIVAVLINDGRTRIIPYLQTLLEEAIIGNDIDLLTVILEDGRFDLHYDKDIAFELARYSENIRFLEILEQYESTQKQI